MTLPEINENQFWLMLWLAFFLTIVSVVAIVCFSGTPTTPEYQELHLKMQYCQSLEQSQRSACYEMVIKNVQHL